MSEAKAVLSTKKKWIVSTFV
jgi:hypothetical protein